MWLGIVMQYKVRLLSSLFSISEFDASAWYSMSLLSRKVSEESHGWDKTKALCHTTMGDRSVETLGSKIRFLSILVPFSPLPPKQCWFFYFFDCTDHSAYTTLNWGAGGLTLEANKIEQMPKYRKASFPKSVSTTFVAHCLEAIYANCGNFLFMSKL